MQGVGTASRKVYVEDDGPDGLTFSFLARLNRTSS